MTTLHALSVAETWQLSAILFVSLLVWALASGYAAPTLIQDAHPQSKWLDGLRGLAASFVALDHAQLALISAQIRPDVFYLTPKASAVLALFGSVGVQLFFCITGALFADRMLTSQEIDWTRFFRRRLQRLVPAYFFAVLLAVVIGAWFGRWNHFEAWSSVPALFSFSLIPMPIINGFDFGRLLGMTWSLAIEWQFYLALPIIFVVTRRNPKLGLVAIAAFAVTDLALTQSSGWAFFVIGAASSRLIKLSASFWLTICALGLLAIGLASLAMTWRDSAHYGFQRALCIGLIFVAMSLLKPRLLAGRVLVAIGTMSYSFYMLHAMIIFACIAAYERYVGGAGTLTLPKFSLLMALVLGVVVVASALSYLLIERRFMHREGKSGNVNSLGEGGASSAPPSLPLSSALDHVR